MEELQDAIEDAQYLTAMHDDMPKPMLPWPKYKDEEIAAFVLKQRTENPPSVELEGMCSGSLGFYMVRPDCRLSRFPSLRFSLIIPSHPLTPP